MKQPIIIIGMQQSGMGWVSKLLSHAGIFMGNDQNVNAESDVFNQLNDWMFAQAGATWDNPYNFSFVDNEFSFQLAEAVKMHLKGKRLKPFLDDARRKYRKVERFDFDWGWTGPLNTFTIGIWREIFVGAKVVHVYRNPLDVAASLKKENDEFAETMSAGFFKGLKRHSLERKLSHERIYSLSLRTKNVEESVSLWNQYLKQALRVEEITGFDTCHICYENLVQDYKSESDKLFDFLGFKIPDGSLMEIAKKIKAEKCFCFLKDNELNEYYQSIKNQSLMTELNYHDIR